MSLDLVVIILCGINMLFAVYSNNWNALVGWFVGGSGFLKCLLMA